VGAAIGDPRRRTGDLAKQGWAGSGISAAEPPTHFCTAVNRARSNAYLRVHNRINALITLAPSSGVGTHIEK